MTVYVRPENGTHFELILPIWAITVSLPTYSSKELLTSTGSDEAGLKTGLSQLLQLLHTNLLLSVNFYYRTISRLLIWFKFTVLN